MRRSLHSLLHRPAIQFGLAQDSRGRFRNPRFASFLAAGNHCSGSDFQDTILRGRRLLRRGLLVALGLGAAWVALESARAIVMF